MDKKFEQFAQWYREKEYDWNAKGITIKKVHPAMYIKKYGDTLRSVCEKFGLDIEKIKGQVMNMDILKKVKVKPVEDIDDAKLPACATLYLGKN